MVVDQQEMCASGMRLISINAIAEIEMVPWTCSR